MTIRRQVGGYEYRNGLDEIKRMGELLTNGLIELGKNASTVEASRTFTQLVGISSKVSVKALELKDYQVKE